MDDESRSEDVGSSPGEPHDDEQALGESVPEPSSSFVPDQDDEGEPPASQKIHPEPQDDDLWAADLLEEPAGEGPSSAAGKLRVTLDTQLARHDKAAFVRTAVESVTSRHMGIPELYRDVLTPLLVDTGAGWQRGQVAVWEEHLASAMVRTVVEILYPGVLKAKLAVPPAGRSVLLAAPPEEQHDLGLRMMADRFDMAGWTTYFLGADSPVGEIVGAARTLGVDAVVLSSATHFHRLALRHVVDRLQKELDHVHVWVGGSAFIGGAEGFASYEVRDIETLLAEFTPPSPEPVVEAPEDDEC